MAVKAVQIRITGKVQGVGYRYFAVGIADELGLTGWVRNTSDGAVEMHVQGDAALVDQFTERVTRGPRWARVDQAWISQVEPEENVPTFRVRG